MHTELPTSTARVHSARSPILTRLRVETAEHHATLEAHLPLHETHLSRATYHALLSRFWAFYAPLEERLLDGSLQWDRPPHFDYRERLKTPKLQQDLYDLGETPDTLMHVPQCDELPPVSTLAEVLGCLYVVEGASLGGQIIARRLQASLELSRDSGARFFNGYGSDTGPYWKATSAFLTACATELDQDDAIVASANATFQSLGRWVAAASFPQ
jgi:heme oxygenase